MFKALQTFSETSTEEEEYIPRDDEAEAALFGNEGLILDDQRVKLYNLEPFNGKL